MEIWTLLTWHTVPIGGSSKVLVVALIVRGAGEAQGRVVELGGCGRGAGRQAAAGQIRRIGGGRRSIAPMRVAGT